MSSNPFPALSAILQAQFYRPVSTATYALRSTVPSVLLGLSLLVVLVCLGIRLHSGGFWLFRTINPGVGTFIQPHPTNTYLLLSIPFLVFVQLYIEQERKQAQYPDDLTDEMIWRTIPWLFLHTGAWLIAWATMIAPVTARQPDSSTRWDLAHYPLAINSYFIGGVIALCVATTPCIVILNRQFNQGQAVFVELDASLKAAAIQFDAGSFPNIVALQSSADLLARLLTQTLLSWERFWTVFTVFTGILFVTFTFACVKQYIVLSALLRSMRSREMTGSMHREQVKAVERRFFSIILISINMALQVGIVLVVIAMLASPALENNIGSPLPSIVSFIALWTTSILGLLGYCVILYRSISDASIAASTKRIKSNAPQLKDNSMELMPPLGGQTTLKDFEESGDSKIYVVKMLGRDSMEGKV